MWKRGEMKNTDKFKVQTFFNMELLELVDQWAEKLGMSRSQLVALSCRAGITHIIAAVSPQDAFTPEKLAEIIKLAQIETEVPDAT